MPSEAKVDRSTITSELSTISTHWWTDVGQHLVDGCRSTLVCEQKSVTTRPCAREQSQGFVTERHDCIRRNAIPAKLV